MKTMAKIHKEAEALHVERAVSRTIERRAVATRLSVTTAISFSTRQLKCRASAIVVLTTTGETAHYPGQVQTSCPLLAVKIAQVARKMQLYRGILPMLYEEGEEEGGLERRRGRQDQFAVDSESEQVHLLPETTVLCSGGGERAPAPPSARILTYN